MRKGPGFSGVIRSQYFTGLGRSGVRDGLLVDLSIFTVFFCCSMIDDRIVFYSVVCLEVATTAKMGACPTSLHRYHCIVTLPSFQTTNRSKPKGSEARRFFPRELLSGIFGGGYRPLTDRALRGVGWYHSSKRMMMTTTTIVCRVVVNA